MEVPQKTKIQLPYDPAIPLLGIYLKKKKKKTQIQKDTCTPIFTAALFMIAKIWKRPKCPSTDEQIKETCGVCGGGGGYTHSGILRSHKKE